MGVFTSPQQQHDGALQGRSWMPCNLKPTTILFLQERSSRLCYAAQNSFKVNLCPLDMLLHGDYGLPPEKTSQRSSYIGFYIGYPVADCQRHFAGAHFSLPPALADMSM